MGYSKVPMDGKVKHIRKYKRRITKIGLEVRNVLFPMKPEWLVWSVLVIAVLNLAGAPPMGQTIKSLQTRFDELFGVSAWNRLGAIVLVAFVLCYAAVVAFRWMFTLMLYYNGWLFESVGKPISLPTKLFMCVIQFVNTHATFFSFNDLLPWMPIPSINSTITKYLRSVRPILSDDKYNELVMQADEFEKGVGRELQKKLWLKWLTSKNYVSDWWKEVVYMRYRNSLINTNVGCADVIHQKTTHLQAARAANITLLRQQFCREIFTKQTMKPITLGGIPLCSNQYIDYHRSLRIPSETSDKMIRCDDARHIAVYCKGCWYKVNIFHGRRMLRPAELERSLQAIIDRTPDPAQGEKYLSALTVGPRDLWARIRNEKFADGVNKESLWAIENALEIVFLDDEERFYDENDTRKYDYEYARTLHGNGYQLWCDKPSIFMFSSNGRFSSNGEHSVVDAMIFVHVREYIKYNEQFVSGYSPDGHCKGDIEVVPNAERLSWNLDQQTQSAIDESYEVGKKVADDFENASIVFKDFGKDFMKKIRVSPDAFIQMAMQMAYFKDQGKFELTYEPALMRLFKDGRTETVRSCSLESCDFVNAMLNADCDDGARLSLLRRACEQHQDYYRMAMAGKGVDRHLFALYIVAKYLQISSPFLDSVFGMSYALSTSQTPQHQMTEYMKVLNKEKDLFWPAGAFCCPEGSNYGVCYTIGATGDALSFHIATWKSLAHTNAYRFRDQILSCLREMHEMCERAVSCGQGSQAK